MRDRILDAALAVLHDTGVRGLTQLAVAERADVRQSHVTYYFPTRRDLLEAVTAEVVEAMLAGLRQVIEQDGGPRRWLESLVASVAEPGHMRMFLAMMVEADGDASVREPMVEATRRMEAEIADVLGGRNAGRRARALLAAVWGYGLREFLVGDGERDLQRAYVRMLTEL